MFEDLKRKQREGFSAGGKPSLFRITHVADPKRRIIILFALLILLGLVAAMLHQYSADPENQRLATEPNREIGVTGEAPRYTGVPALDRSVAASITDATPDERRHVPKDALEYLILEARHTPAVLAYNANLFPVTAGSATEIDRDSAPWRFQFVRFRGRLESIREENFAREYGGSGDIGQVHRGLLRVADGEPPVRVTFFYPYAPMENVDLPDGSIRQKLIRDGWVRGRGIVVKNFLDTTSEGEAPSLLVVATFLQRDYETQPVESLEDIPFQIINDDPSLVGQPGFEKLLFKRYPIPMFRLLEYAEARAGKAGAELRAAEELKPDSFDDIETWEEVQGQPARYRAHYFGGKGAIATRPLYYGPEMTEPNDAGIDEFLFGYIYTDKQHLFQYVAPASLARPDGWPPRTRIYYEGYFYKTQAYPARNGTDRLAPLLVLTRLEEIQPTPPDHTFQITIAAAFILGISMLVFIIVREDKTKNDYRRHRSRRTIRID